MVICKALPPFCLFYRSDELGNIQHFVTVRDVEFASFVYTPCVCTNVYICVCKLILESDLSFFACECVYIQNNSQTPCYSVAVRSVITGKQRTYIAIFNNVSIIDRRLSTMVAEEMLHPIPSLLHLIIQCF